MSTQDYSQGRIVLQDSPENRAKLTEEYFKLVPFEQLLVDAGGEIANRMPEQHREEFKKFWQTMMSPSNLGAIIAPAKESLSRHMTTSELSAFIRFMGDPAGRSAMDKMRFYMADIMPLVQQIVQQGMAQFAASQGLDKQSK